MLLTKNKRKISEINKIIHFDIVDFDLFSKSLIGCIFGLLGFETFAIATNAITLKISPNPIMIKMFSSKPFGVYFSWTLSMAVIPD